MDYSDYIPKVTIKNVTRISFKKMLLALKPYTQEHIPEGILHDPDAYTEIERLIGRTANLYAYLMHLYAYVANETTRAKLVGDTELKDKLMRKRDALFELGRAVHYKQEACSRMLTAALGYDKGVFERVDGKAREEQADGRKKMRGWDNL
jgi:hypothetical protein